MIILQIMLQTLQGDWKCLLICSVQHMPSWLTMSCKRGKTDWIPEVFNASLREAVTKFISPPQVTGEKVHFVICNLFCLHSIYTLELVYTALDMYYLVNPPFPQEVHSRIPHRKPNSADNEIHRWRASEHLWATYWYLLCCIWPPNQDGTGDDHAM